MRILNAANTAGADGFAVNWFPLSVIVLRFRCRRAGCCNVFKLYVELFIALQILSVFVST